MMTYIELRDKRRQLADGNKSAPTTLTEVPLRVLRSKRFLVQIFAEDHGAMRMSIARTELDSEGRWKDGITWDEMQTIKRECGYGLKDGRIIPKRFRPRQCRQHAAPLDFERVAAVEMETA